MCSLPNGMQARWGTSLGFHSTVSLMWLLVFLLRLLFSFILLRDKLTLKEHWLHFVCCKVSEEFPSILLECKWSTPGVFHCSTFLLYSPSFFCFHLISVHTMVWKVNIFLFFYHLFKTAFVGSKLGSLTAPLSLICHCNVFFSSYASTEFEERNFRLFKICSECSRVC